VSVRGRSPTDGAAGSNCTVILGESGDRRSYRDNVRVAPVPVVMSVVSFRKVV
jgi:hypothetical protein